MPPAARSGDSTSHPGSITGVGVPTVLIGGQPASVVGDTHTCNYPDRRTPHPQTAIVKGSATVMIGSRPAARIGDSAACGATIVSGSPTVEIGG